MRLITLREAQQQNLQQAIYAMADCCYGEWTKIYNVEYNIFNAEGVVNDFSDMNNIDKAPYAILALDDKNEFVGCFAVQLDDDLKQLDKGPEWIDGPWLVCMYVVPQHRGKGIMRMLLTHMMEWVDQHLTQWQYIYLWTENVARVYEQVGFKHLRYYKIPYEDTTVEIMRRELPLYKPVVRTLQSDEVKLLPLAEVEKIAPQAIYTMAAGVLNEWRDVYVNQYGMDTVEKVVEDFRIMLNVDKPSYCLVALSNDTNSFVGCCAIQNEHELLFDFDKGTDHVEGPWIACMFVRPEYRGRGVMRKLLNGMMEWVDRSCQQFEFVYLWTENVAKVYASVGFETIGDVVTCGKLSQLMKRPVGRRT